MLNGLIEAIAAAGIEPAEPVPTNPGGRVRRFKVEGDKGHARSGWVQIFDNADGTFGAKFGDWRSGIKGTWFSGKTHHVLTDEERRAYAKKMAADRRRMAEAEAHRYRHAAEKAAEFWRNSRSADQQQAYLARKGIKPHTLRMFCGSLVVDVRDVTGRLTSLQFINTEGQKRFLSGGEIRGCFHRVGPEPGAVVLIAEGFATAASLFEATGHPCFVAFSAGNLKPVALALRGRYSHSKIIICADADPVGLSAAKEAAAAVNGQWIAPDFDKDGAVNEVPHDKKRQ